ncbi:MAG: aconitate hydratase [Candidatus Margulisiibacteriota bacterium]|jgi:aconitate hydratase
MKSKEDDFSAFYQKLSANILAAKNALETPLTLTEKILYSHLFERSSAQTILPDFSAAGEKYLDIKKINRGESYLNFRPDRVAMQDATAQMAILQLIAADCKKVSLPTSLHLDHLIKARNGVSIDLPRAIEENQEVYDFLLSSAKRFGIDFWGPNSGIIHQIVLENYALPGGLLIGTDSHTPTSGGVGMLGIGVGGSDAVDAILGLEWELKMPKIMGVKLTGKLSSNWVSAKDLILKICGLLTVKGGTGYVLEYFGEGVKEFSAASRATICNMGAEVGATGSVFPYDETVSDYLKSTSRLGLAQCVQEFSFDLRADTAVYENPEKYFDRVIEIDLSQLEPFLNGPFTPDQAYPISEFKKAVEENQYPQNLTFGLIGSCTNSSYEDFSKVAAILKQAKENQLELKMPVFISLGSERLFNTLKQEGLIDFFTENKLVLLANACGPCIGQWERKDLENQEANSILISFNRNFAKRNDGNPNTYAFITSPEIIMAKAFSADLRFNPLSDELVNTKGEKVKFAPPVKLALPLAGLLPTTINFQKISDQNQTVFIKPNSDRLALLNPFPKWAGNDLKDLRLLIKVKGKCTTDHISMAGPWLKYRGHLDKISDNLLMGAINAFNNETNKVKNLTANNYMTVSSSARYYQNQGVGTIVVAEENYGEGSSREHAAMEPRFLGVSAIIAKSFARIHETNLKKQGLLALIFVNKLDYDLICEDDTFDLIGLENFSANQPLILVVRHQDGSQDKIMLNHSYETKQIDWFCAGSALNYLRLRG